jgi:hypothetical protein
MVLALFLSQQRGEGLLLTDLAVVVVGARDIPFVLGLSACPGGEQVGHDGRG